MTTVILQQVVNGLILGGCYGLMAVGLTLVYGVLYQANFAHCDQYVLAGYAMYFCLAAGLGFPIATLAAIATGTFVGLLFYRFLWRPTVELSHGVSVLVFFGASVLLEGAIIGFYSPNPQPIIVPFYGKPLYVGDVMVTQGRVMALFLSVGLLVGIHLLVTRTRLGTAMRAVSQDLGAAKLMGISVPYIGLIVFLLGGMLAGVGAVLILPIFGAVSPTGGFWMVIRAFVLILIGGLGNVAGAIVASMAMGLLESLAGGLIYAPLKDLIPWLLLILVLWVKPQGVFGKAIRRA